MYKKLPPFAFHSVSLLTILKPLDKKLATSYNVLAAELSLAFNLSFNGFSVFLAPSIIIQAPVPAESDLFIIRKAGLNPV
jgi:hypothetical protein